MDAFKAIPLSLTSLLFGASFAHSAIIASDDFEDYLAGSNIHNGNFGSGFTNPWNAVGDHSTAQSNSLSVPSSGVDGGSQALRLQPTTNLGDEGSFISRTIPATTDTLYLSMIVRKEVMDGSDFINFMVSDGATGNTNGALSFGLRNVSGNPIFARVGSSSSGQTIDSINAVANTNYLLIGKFSKDGSANYNRADLYINPTSAVEPGTADAIAISSVTGIDTLSLFNVRHFQPEAGDTIWVDRMVFATSFEEAFSGIPEPSTTTVLGLVAGLGLLRRRRK